MKKIIPFKKQLTFKTKVSEIISIALENTLKAKENKVEGELIINGTYKITETSTNVDDFEFIIPINIEIDERYITKEIQTDINDFYYEIIDNSILEVNIEILLENIIEKKIEEKEPPLTLAPIIEEESKMQEKSEIKEQKDIKEERCIEEEQEKVEENKIDIFNDFTNEQEEYSTYHIYIVREGDTIETILNKYKTTKEKISEYNDLSELKIGDKIIISE